MKRVWKFSTSDDENLRLKIAAPGGTQNTFKNFYLYGLKKIDSWN